MTTLQVKGSNSQFGALVFLDIEPSPLITSLVLAAGAKGEATDLDKDVLLFLHSKPTEPSAQDPAGPTQLPAWPENKNQNFNERGGSPGCSQDK